MSTHQLTNSEIAPNLASSIKARQVSLDGGSISQEDLFKSARGSVTSLKNIEATRSVKLKLIFILRGMDLLDDFLSGLV